MTEPTDQTVPLPTAQPADPYAPEHDAAPSPVARAKPAAQAGATHDGVRRPASVSTIVWGLVLVVLGVGVVALALGARFDLGLALVLVLGGGGLTLLISSAWSGRRTARSGPRA